jgi:hypothetical protein
VESVTENRAEDSSNLIGTCPVDGCSETFLGVSVETLREHVIEVHGYLAVLDCPGLGYIPDRPPSSKGDSD